MTTKSLPKQIKVTCSICGEEGLDKGPWGLHPNHHKECVIYLRKRIEELETDVRTLLMSSDDY